MAYLIGTAGHVDHGKTTLIAALTGIDTDRLPEEKTRGLTIDIGFAYLDLPEIGRVSIVDVPGHERFIKNMLAGAWGVDVALLCVASDESVMPQTREHFEIIRLLEARKMVVAMTKCDMTDEETQDIVEMDIRALLENTPYAESPIVRVSAKERVGLDALKKALSDAILSLGPREIEEKSWFLPIDRVFRVGGHGTVVTGTLAKGKVRVGDEGVVMPGNRKVRIRNIQVHGESVKEAEAGQRTALNVAGIEMEALHRGQAIGSPGSLVETKCINVRLVSIEKPKHGERVRVHIGSGEFFGKLILFDAAPGYAQIRFEEAVACSKGQRFVIRRYSPPILLGGGEIVTPNARIRRKSDPTVRELFTNETTDSVRSVEESILAEVEKHPEGVETSAICETLGRTPQELGEAFEKLKQQNKILGFAGIWITAENYKNLAERIRKILYTLHEKEPTLAAIPKSRLIQASGISWNTKSWDRFLSKLNEDGFVRLMGGDVRHPDFAIQLNERQKALLERVLEVMNSRGAIAPSPSEVANELRIPQQAVEEIFRLGIELGVLVKLDEGLVYSKETLERLKDTVRKLGPKFTVAQFRDATKSSRKYALPILQYMDEQRVTRRVGEERVVIG
ncbi:MAG TPA: selenocysteine-specific translation elongation factor [Fimbriimonadales bacterium]|nr:selenocysteine-specific translation elongation factor [Fimbriimonadales bacterium]